MRKIKKSISFALCLFILVNFVLPLKAATLDQCTHNCGEYEERIFSGYVVGGTTATHHIKEFIVHIRCSGENCNYIKSTFIVPVVENHAFKTVNLGHIGTTNQHKYGSCCDCNYPGEEHIVPCLYKDCMG